MLQSVFQTALFRFEFEYIRHSAGSSIDMERDIGTPHPDFSPFTFDGS